MGSTAPPPRPALPAWLGCRLYDADGARLGLVADVLFDERTSAPGWLSVVLDRAADRFALVPARGTRHRAGGVQVRTARALVCSAPSTPLPPDALGPGHAAALARHYGVRCGGGPWRGVAETAVARTPERLPLAA